MNSTKNPPATVRIQRPYHPFNPDWEHVQTRPDCRDCVVPLYNGAHCVPDVRPRMVACIWPERSPDEYWLRVAEVSKLHNLCELKSWIDATLNGAQN